MASPELIAAGATGNTGALTGSYWFHLKQGSRLEISTDGGTTYNELTTGFNNIVISDQTVHWRNPTDKIAVLNYMPI